MKAHIKGPLYDTQKRTNLEYLPIVVPLPPDRTHTTVPARGVQDREPISAGDPLLIRRSRCVG